jgi:hypothetical protein
MNEKWYFSPDDNPEPKNPERQMPAPVPPGEWPGIKNPFPRPDRGGGPALPEVHPLIQPIEPWPEPRHPPKDPNEN